MVDAKVLINTPLTEDNSNASVNGPIDSSYQDNNVTTQVYAPNLQQNNILNTPTIDAILTLDTPIDVDISAGGYKIYKFTPSTTGNYRVFTDYYGGDSSNGDSDTELYLYSDPELTNELAYNDDYDDENYFSEITWNMTEEINYYIKLT